MAGNENEPRKQFGVRLEESVIEKLGVLAKAQNLSTAEYVRNLIDAALNGKPEAGGGNDFGLSASVMERITDDAQALNIAPAEYIRTLLYNALTKDPGQDIGELRGTVLQLHDRVAHLEDMLLEMFEALLLTLATDSKGHTKNQIQEMMSAVFPRK